MTDAEVLARIFRRCRREGGCLLWTGATTRGGYGNINHGGRYWRAPRLVETLTRGPIDPGQVVLHSCDRPACVEPSHLSRGTPGDNVRDAALKGRLGGWRDPNARSRSTLYRRRREAAGLPLDYTTLAQRRRA